MRFLFAGNILSGLGIVYLLKKDDDYLFIPEIKTESIFIKIKNGFKRFLYWSK
jgi:hypothetical protein